MPNSVQERIAALTEALRSSDDPVMARLRHLLSQRCVDPAGSVLAAFFDDGAHYWTYVVTPERRVWGCTYEFLGKEIGAGTICEWDDLTDDPEYDTFHEEIGCALAMLNSA